MTEDILNEKYIPVFYIPPFLSRMWMLEDRTFRIYNRITAKKISQTTGQIFRERVLVNTSDIAFLELSSFLDPAFVDIFTRLQKGDASLLDLDFYHTSYLIKMLSSYTNIRKEYRNCALNRLSENKGKVDERECGDIPLVTSELKKMLRYSSLFFYSTSDLCGRLLTAPENRPFILGDNPVILFNPLLSEDDPATAADFTANGTCVVLPLSEKYALFLYDEGVYTVPDSNVIEICDDDWFRINEAEYAQSEGILYRSESVLPLFEVNSELKNSEHLISVPEEDIDPDYPPEILSRLSLSFLDLKRDIYIRIERGEDFSEEPRPFIKKMEKYDLKMMESKIAPGDIDIIFRALKERKKYVTELCSERKKIYV